MLVKDNPNYRKLTPKKKTCLKIKNLCWNVTKLSWNFRNFLLLEMQFVQIFLSNLGGSTFVKIRLKRKITAEKHCKTCWSSRRISVFAYLPPGFHQTLYFVDCIIESRICDRQIKEKCIMEWWSLAPCFG